MVNIGNDWDDLLAAEFEKEYYKNLRAFLIKEYSTRKIFPDMHFIFEALKHTSYKDTKVLILGQDLIMEIIKLTACHFQFSQM